MTINKILTTCFSIILVACTVLSQNHGDTTGGCELTYKSILEKNNLLQNPWVKNWFATYNKSPAPAWTAGWKKDRIVSYVLIEHPNFHAGERTTLWLVRTKSQAFYWESVQADYHSVVEIEKRTQRKEIMPADYDKFFEPAASWQQTAILKPKLPVDNFSPEFWGVATIFTGNLCRQMLLGLDDFMSCKTKECKKPLKSGKIMLALEPIVLEGQISP